MFGRMLALSILAAGAFAGTAQASVIDTDPVKLTSTGYDFGDSSWGIGAPFGSGEIHFHHESGGIRAHVLGSLHMNDADGTCSRMRLRYYNDSGTQIEERFGGTVCAFDDSHHEFTVDLDPYRDPAVASVQVAVMKQTATGEFVATSLTYGANTFDDQVQITQDGVDFGTTVWGIGQPNGYGLMSWGLDDADVEPHLIGAIHLNNSSGVCARVNLRYLTEFSVFLTERAGGTVCAPDNGHHSWRVDLAPYDSNKIGKVTVQLQTMGANGTWNTAGSQTVSIAE